jgi:hypothetical protein
MGGGPRPDVAAADGGGDAHLVVPKFRDNGSRGLGRKGAQRSFIAPSPPPRPHAAFLLPPPPQPLRLPLLLPLLLLLAAGPVTYPGVAAEAQTLSAGARHTCAIDAADKAHCWGDDARGQSSPPYNPRGWRSVAASKGGCHTCGVDLAAGLYTLHAVGTYEYTRSAPPESAWLQPKNLQCDILVSSSRFAFKL